MNVFGDPIFSYTRRQAIDDGILVRVPTDKTPFKHPVVFTVALWAEVEHPDPSMQDGRIWDVCYMAVLAAKRAGGSDVYYKAIVGRRTLDLWCNCGPDDDGAPCITIGFPSDR